MGVAIFGTNARASLTTNAQFRVDNGHHFAFALFFVFINEFQFIIHGLQL
jgi:hypothetical protein